MQFGMVGLGRTGTGVALRLMAGGHRCVAYDEDRDRVAALSRQGAVGARSLADLAGNLHPPRVVWLMLPAGEPTAHAMMQLADHLQAGDITVDGSDSRYQDAILRRDRLGDRGIDHVDCAAAISQDMDGYLLMLGGRKSAVGYLDPMLRTAVPEGRECLHCGSNGSAHFVQLVRARIGEATMESFADGFDLLSHGDAFGYELPLNDIAQIWRDDALISSRAAATRSLYEQLRSEANRCFAEKILSAMRLAFGGESMAR